MVASSIVSGILGAILSVPFVYLLTFFPQGDLRWILIAGAALVIGGVLQYVVHIVSNKIESKQHVRSGTMRITSHQPPEPLIKQEDDTPEPPGICTLTPQQLIDEYSKVASYSVNVRKAMIDDYRGSLLRTSITVRLVSNYTHVRGESVLVSANDHPLICNFEDVESVERLKRVAKGDVLYVEGAIEGIDETHINLARCKLLSPPRRDL